MKTTLRIAFGVAVLLVAGCATTFKPWQLSEIQEGMAQDQVVKILGMPDSSTTKNGAEYYYYSYKEEMTPVSDVTLETTEGIDRRVEEFNRTLKESKYEVILVDGKLLNYKELLD